MSRHPAFGLTLAASMGWAAAVPAAVPAPPAPSADLAPIQSGLDYHSFANIEQFRVTHLELDLRMDLRTQSLGGVVGLQVKRLDPAATELVLDTRDLIVLQVTQKAQNVLGAMSKSETTWVNRPYHFEKKDPILGQALVIELPPSKKPTELIRIDYETSSTVPALQWATGKRKGFFYTQSGPIGARSWIPTQDTPQVRVTYLATIHTPPEVLAVMSAGNDPKAKRNGEYAFIMRDAIPASQIALAVGDLAFKETGARSGVYAEKSLLKAAAAQFADTDSLLASGEKLFGPYRWDRLDIVVMPASFPVAGRAQPRLAFLSPTLIAGDKNQVSVLAQAVAHAWTGSLTGIASWRDAWINEALSGYAANRIIEAVYGERRATMERVVGWRALERELTAGKSGDQVLAIDLRDRDPAASLGRIPTEKGRLFLEYLDARFGRERFDAFLRAYVDHFSFQSVSTEQFVAYLEENLLNRYPHIVSRAAVMAWVSGPGIPPDAVRPSTDVFAPVDAARTQWLAGAVPAKKLDTRTWVSPEWVDFLDAMPATLAGARLDELDAAYGFSRSPDAEIGRSWFLLVIRNRYQPGYVHLEEYLRTVGRLDLLMPLYRELMKSPAGATQAKRVFALARAGYQAQTAAALGALVDPDADADESTDE
jgi:aminopeptidase N